MRTFLLMLIFLPSIISAQNTYAASYRILSGFDNESTLNEVRNLVLNSMTYNFVSSPSACFLKSTSQMEASGISVDVKGEEHIYINYLTKTAFYKLDGNCMRFAEVKFVKSESDLKVNGYNATKYVSEDKNLIIYTSSEIPWYVQPSLFAVQKFKGGVIKFQNIKSQYGFELISKEVLKNDVDAKTFKSISTQRCTEVDVKINPFFT